MKMLTWLDGPFCGGVRKIANNGLDFGGRYPTRFTACASVSARLAIMSDASNDTLQGQGRLRAERKTIAHNPGF
jgi:hypothetical protein